jgi:hypothetical protein
LPPVRDVLYEVDGERFLPTDYTRGPWSLDHQHAGPPAALLTRAVEGASAIEGGQSVRLAFDILRPVPVAPLTVAVRRLRPGRNVEQLEASLLDGETEVMRARVWRMRTEAVDLEDGLGEPLPPPAPPEDAVAGVRPHWWPEGSNAYHDALDWRWLRGHFVEPGPAVCWTRMNVDLVPGEPITPLQHLLVMADAASGISSALDWAVWNFINVDLSLALERPPAGEWLAMDAVTTFGPVGAAVATAVYSDLDGRVGTSSQAILVAPK